MTGDPTNDAVLFDARDDGIAVITLNRPETRNCLTAEVRAGLYAAWDRFENDPGLRVAADGSVSLSVLDPGDPGEALPTGSIS